MSDDGDSAPPSVAHESGASISTQIIQELIRIEEQDGACDLVQFRSLVGAEQYRLLYPIVQKYVAAGAEVLDWGCGNGHFSYALTRLGYNVTGYSFEDFPLRRYLGEDYKFERGSTVSPETLPFTGGKFDAVMSIGVLEHVRETGGNEEASLREISRVMKPGGHFICFHLPNLYSFIEAVTAHLPREHHHAYRFTADAIRELCGRTGFEILEMRRYGALPRNPWERLPRPVRNSSLVAGAWNLIDRTLEYPLSALCQNYTFVARKPLP